LQWLVHKFDSNRDYTDYWRSAAKTKNTLIYYSFVADVRLCQSDKAVSVSPGPATPKGELQATIHPE